MNEKINIAEILKDCPKGTKLYSPMFGEVKFYVVDPICGNDYIKVKTCSEDVEYFHPNGHYFTGYNDSECLLFPSKDQRDWTKFKVKTAKKERFDIHTLKPFDKVLYRSDCEYEWDIDLFGYIDAKTNANVCLYHSVDEGQLIPYNEETAFLVGTTDDCPEFYKWWEE